MRGQGSTLSLKSCQVYDGGRCGIELLSGAGLTAEATKVGGNGWSGIEVSQGAAASLRRCIVTKNGMFGVQFKAHSSGLLDKNTVSAHSAIYSDIKIDPLAKVDDSNASRNLLCKDRNRFISSSLADGNASARY